MCWDGNSPPDLGGDWSTRYIQTSFTSHPLRSTSTTPFCRSPFILPWTRMVYDRACRLLETKCSSSPAKISLLYVYARVKMFENCDLYGRRRYAGTSKAGQRWVHVDGRLDGC